MALTKPSGSVQSLPIALPIAGGTLTGPLTLAADPAVALGAATKQYTDTGISTRLALSGGTMTGTLTLAADPLNALDSATKNYVDVTAVTAANVPPFLLMAQGVI